MNLEVIQHSFTQTDHWFQSFLRRNLSFFHCYVVYRDTWKPSCEHVTNQRTNFNSLQACVTFVSGLLIGRCDKHGRPDRLFISLEEILWKTSQYAGLWGDFIYKKMVSHHTEYRIILCKNMIRIGSEKGFIGRDIAGSRGLLRKLHGGREAGRIGYKQPTCELFVTNERSLTTDWQHISTRGSVMIGPKTYLWTVDIAY